MNPLLLWGLSSLPVVGPCAMGGVYGEIVSQSFLPISMWFSSGLLDVKGLLCQFSGFLLFIEFRNCSIYRCRFGVSMGGNEFRIFFHCHLPV